MNVWKYIYIKFFNIRRRIIGRDGADEYAAMLFVASFDALLYFGILILIDKSVDEVLSKEYEPLYFAFYMLWMLTIERLRNRTMCKNGAFERMKEEVENESQKLKWSILSILYMIFVVFFSYFAVISGNTGYDLLFCEMK